MSICPRSTAGRKHLPSSNTSSLPEVVGDAALCVDPYNVDVIAEALRLAIEDGAMRQTLVDRGYERARQFTWKSAARLLRELYTKLLSYG